MERNLSSRPARRPLSMWIILAAYLLITLFGFTRMLSSIVNWYWLNFAGVAPGPLYLAVTGGMSGLVSLVVLVWVWLRSPGFRLIGTAGALFFALIYWADRLLVMKFAEKMQNAPFAVVVTMVGLAYITITLRPWEELRVMLHRFKGAR